MNQLTINWSESVFEFFYKLYIAENLMGFQLHLSHVKNTHANEQTKIEDQRKICGKDCAQSD